MHKKLVSFWNLLQVPFVFLRPLQHDAGRVATYSYFAELFLLFRFVENSQNNNLLII